MKRRAVKKKRQTAAEKIAQIIREAVEAGISVEMEGLGLFRPAEGGFEFVRDTAPTVFIAYVREDLAKARRLYHDLEALGFRPWLDLEKLLPGQNWSRSIERTIEVSDFFIPCFSKNSVSKRGHFQSELRYALDCASRLPLDEIFVIPVRLDDCPLPRRILSQIHYVNLFPEWEKGIRRVRAAIERETRSREQLRLPLAG
jgi:hypothetical protein